MDLESNNIISCQGMPELTECGRKVHGLLKSYHGIVYQLQWLMVVALQSQKQCLESGFKFKTEVEERDAGKFDDVVWKYLDNDVIKYNFLQCKHRYNCAEKITLNELLKTAEHTNNPFSMQKYFVSYRDNIKDKIHQDLNNYKDGVIENLIIATNLTFEENVKYYLELVRSKNPIIRALQRQHGIHGENLSCWKINTTNIPEGIKNRLEETYDLIKLAKKLGEYIRNHKLFTLPDDLKLYHKALFDNIVNKTDKKISENFINGKNISKQAEYLRQAFLQEEFTKKRAAANVFSHKVIGNPTEIAIKLSELLKECNNNVVKINRTFKVFKENIDALSGYILIEDDGIKFNNKFWTSNESELPNESIKIFKNTFLLNLRKNGLINAEDSSTHIAQKFESYRFVITNFKTCRKELVDETSFWDTVRMYNKLEINTEKSTKEQETDLPNYSLSDISNDISRFFGLLTFVVNCSKTNLTSFVEKELKEEFKFIDNDYLAYAFRTEIAKSLDLSEDIFITSSRGVTEFIEKAKSHINSFILMGPTLEYQIKTELLRVKFGRRKIKRLKIHNFIFNTNDQVLIMHTNHVKLSSVKVLQILKMFPTFNCKGTYIFMQIDTILYLQDLVIQAFKSNCNLLIIEYNTQMSGVNSDLEELYEELVRILHSNKAKKVIIIQDESNLFIEMLKNNKDKYVYKEIFDKFNNIMNLSMKSRERIMRDSQILFQGEKMNMGKILVDEIQHLVQDEMLFNVINRNDIHIGKAVIDLGNIKDYYIPRSFCRSISLNKDVLNGDDTFAISNINKLQLIQILKKINKSIEHNAIIEYDNKNYTQFTQYIILDGNNPQKQYSDLCNLLPQKTIHWLEYIAECFIWQKSQGTLDNLRLHFNDVEFEYKDVTIFQKDKSEKTIVLSAEPGMGKSTVTTKLASLLKINTIKWIMRVNLINLSTELKEHVDDEFVIKFLYSAENNIFKSTRDNPMLEKIIKNSYLRHGKIILERKKSLKSYEMFEIEIFNYLFNNGKVVVLLDGFDEICSVYKHNCLEFIKILKNTMVAKIFITTRPYNIVDSLENLVSNFKYTLKRFNYAEQQKFLFLYWKSNFKIQDEIDEERANIFIKELLQEFSHATRDSERNFVSIPLQLRMLADNFQMIFFEFYNSTVADLNNLYKSKIKTKLNLLTLYEDFLMTKFNKIRFQDKKPGSNTDEADTHNIKEREYEKFLSDHRNLAIYRLFKNTIADTLIEVNTDLLEDFKEANDKNGIIYSVIDDLPIFVHQTFAEYFASSYFWDKFKTCEFSEFKTFYLKNVLLKILVTVEHTQICNFFSLMARRDLADRELLMKNKITCLLECLIDVIKYIYDEYENGGTDNRDGSDDVRVSYRLNCNSFVDVNVACIKLLFVVIEYYLIANESENNEIREIIKRDATNNLLRMASEVGCVNFANLFMQIGHWEVDEYKKELRNKKWYFTPLWLAAKNNNLNVLQILSNVYNPQWIDKDNMSLKERVFAVNEINVLDACLTLCVLNGSPFRDLNRVERLPLVSALECRYPSYLIKKLVSVTDIQVINEFKEPGELSAAFKMICYFLFYDDDTIQSVISSGINFEGVLNLLLFEYSRNTLHDPIDCLKYAHYVKCSFFTDKEYLKMDVLIKILLQSGVPFNSKCDRYNKFTFQYAEGIHQIHTFLNAALNTENPLNTIAKHFIENFPNLRKIDFDIHQIWLMNGKQCLSLIPTALHELMKQLSQNKSDCNLQSLLNYIKEAKEEIERFSTYHDNKTYNNILIGYEEMLQYDGRLKNKKQKLSLFKSLGKLETFLLQRILIYYIRQDYNVIDAYKEVSTDVQKAIRLLNWIHCNKNIKVSMDDILQILDLSNIETSVDMKQLTVKICENKSIDLLHSSWSDLSFIGQMKTTEIMKAMTKYLHVSSQIYSLFQRLNGSYKDLTSTILSENYDRLNYVLNNVDPRYIKSVINGQDAVCGSPLHYAVYKGNISLTKILLSFKANTNYKLTEHGVLLSEIPNDESVDCIYHTHECENYEGFTPLHLAVIKGNIDIIQLLIKNGADCYIKNNSGETSLQIAECKLSLHYENYQNIVIILKAAKTDKKCTLLVTERNYKSTINQINENVTCEIENMKIDNVFPSTSKSTRKRKEKQEIF